jgi:CRP-like cAMP-binding protein
MISRNENWLGQLSPEGACFVKQHGVVSAFRAGEEISAAGIESVAIYQMQSGFSKLIRATSSGETSVLFVFGAGNSWGESPIMGGRPTRHACVALTDCQVLLLRRSAFMRLYREFSEVPDLLCRRFARSMSRSVRAHPLPPSEKLGRVLARSLAECIIDLPRAPGSNSVEIDFPLTQNDIASHLGVTRQSIHRELSALRTAGVIEKPGERWIIRDIRRLLALADTQQTSVDSTLNSAVR